LGDDVAARKRRSSMASIAPLDAAVVASLRAGASISCLAAAAEELVLNALDAGATSVGATLLFDRFGARVEDNGSGVRREDFALLGEASATSKRAWWQGARAAEEPLPMPLASSSALVSSSNASSSASSSSSSSSSASSSLLSSSAALAPAVFAPAPTYGFRGRALHDIAALGILELTSRAAPDAEAWGKVVSYGSVEWCGRVAGAGPALAPQQRGTVASVRGLFGRQPVRQRTLSHRQELDRLLVSVVRMSLVHPGCAFVVRDGDGAGSLAAAAAAAAVAEAGAEAAAAAGAKVNGGGEA
jgi:DNA mismatch repair ATPase MutL